MMILAVCVFNPFVRSIIQSFVKQGSYIHHSSMRSLNRKSMEHVPWELDMAFGMEREMNCAFCQFTSQHP